MLIAFGLWRLSSLRKEAEDVLVRLDRFRDQQIPGQERGGRIDEPEPADRFGRWWRRWLGPNSRCRRFCRRLVSGVELGLLEELSFGGTTASAGERSIGGVVNVQKFPFPRVLLQGVEQYCGHCGKVGAKKKCKGCMLLRYCDESCQKAAWKLHKPMCQSMSDMREAFTTTNADPNEMKRGLQEEFHEALRFCFPKLVCHRPTAVVFVAAGLCGWFNIFKPNLQTNFQKFRIKL